MKAIGSHSDLKIGARRILIAFGFLAINYLALAQSPSNLNEMQIDVFRGRVSNDYIELHQLLSTRNEDTSRVDVLSQLAHYHKFQRPDSGIYYASKALALARTLEFRSGELAALHVLALSNRTLSNFSKALQIDLEGLRLAEKYNLIYPRGLFQFNLGIIHILLADHEKGLTYLRESIGILKKTDTDLLILAENSMGKAYSEMGEMDSAFYYVHRAYAKAIKTNLPWVIIWPSRQLGELHYRLQNSDSAHYYFQRALALEDHTANAAVRSNAALLRAKLFQQQSQTDSSAFFANIARESAIYAGLHGEAIDACLFLTELYKEIDLSKALDFNEIAITYRDSLDQLRQNTTFEDILDFDTQQRQLEIESARSQFRSRLRTNALLGSSFTFLVIAFLLYRNNRQKQKAKLNIETAYDQLKATQSQLIQSDKMASLGELTAGIAHEIQNPLNFVNNFSEVNTEYLVMFLGISPKNPDKIFQPYFKTKSTGQITGLVISISYNIVHANGGTIVVNTFNGPPGGELKVQSTEREGAEFIIQLPIQ